MKKFLVVLLSLGFVMTFSVSAFAVGADFYGEYYAVSRYYDQPSLLERSSPGAGAKATWSDSFAGWEQRFRLFSRFEVVKGLTMTTRADIMEGHWGQNTKGVPSNLTTSSNALVTTLNNSINVEQTWLSFSAPIIGSWNFGWKSARPFGWGTAFMNSTGTNPGVEWSYNIGDIRVFLDWYKVTKGNLNTAAGSSSYGANMTTGGTDTDNDLYDLGMFYRTKAFDTGLMVSYIRDASAKSGVTAAPPAAVKTGSILAGYKNESFALQPYFKGNFGPVALEAEGYWFIGKMKPEAAPGLDVDIDAKGLMLNGKFNIGPAYVGGIFLYNSGNKMEGVADTKYEGSVNSMMGGFNRDKGDGYYGDFITMIQGYHYHDHVPAGGDPTSFDFGSIIDNMWLFQVYGGADITKKLSLTGRFSLAKADQDGAATGWVSKEYGKELDVKVSFKIYDQLTYNVIGAYHWVGDWYKGTNTAAQLKNAYYVFQMVDLNF